MKLKIIKDVLASDGSILLPVDSILQSAMEQPVTPTCPYQYSGLFVSSYGSYRMQVLAEEVELIEEPIETPIAPPPIKTTAESLQPAPTASTEISNENS